MKIVDFITNNWAIITPVLVAVISEVMALHPKSKANGILQLVLSLLKKK